MAEQGISTTGLWVDNETYQVVDKEPSGPEGGRLLVAPGGVISPNVQFDIDAARRAAPAVETATEPAAESTADESGPTDQATEPDDEQAADAKPAARAVKSSGTRR